MITMRSPPQPQWIRKPWHIFVFLSQTKAILMRPPLALRPNWIGPEVGLFSSEIQSSSKSLYFYDVARMWRCDEKVRQTCDATRQWGIQSRQDWKKRKIRAKTKFDLPEGGKRMEDRRSGLFWLSCCVWSSLSWTCSIIFDGKSFFKVFFPSHVASNFIRDPSFKK